MKKQLLSAFCLLFGISLSVHAQYTPIGSTWYYGLFTASNGNPSVQGVYTYTTVSDTSIENNTYSKIVSNDSTSSAFLTKDGDSIWYWMDGAKHLLFKTGASLHDTLVIDCYFSMKHRTGKEDTIVSLAVEITYTHYIKNLLANDSLKEYTFEILTPSKIPDQYYSGMGSYTEKVIKSYEDVNTDLLELSEIISQGDGSYLRCFNSGSYNYKSTSFPLYACDFSNTGIAEQFQPASISIYPVPVDKELHIRIPSNDGKEAVVRIFNSLGELVNEVPMPSSALTLNTDELLPGIYFLEYHNRDFVATAKFIKE